MSLWRRIKRWTGWPWRDVASCPHPADRVKFFALPRTGAWLSYYSCKDCGALLLTDGYLGTRWTVEGERSERYQARMSR